MAPARGVVFDLDGTLIDSIDDIVAATNAALRRHGFAELEKPEIAGYVGDGARLLLSRAARLEPAADELGPLLSSFLEHYTAHAADHTRLLPGAREALAGLGDLPLALCTNKPRQTTLRVVELLGLARCFRAVVAGGDSARPKPDPESLRLVAAALSLEPAELVMVGDGPQDVECARAAGARSVGVLGGIASRQRLIAARPDALIDSLLELPAIVRGWAS